MRGLIVFTVVAANLIAARKETSFAQDVAPLLAKHCQECHRPGEAAPFSLLSYKEARPWAKAIKAAVISKKMPPWFANPAHGKFANERMLSQADIDTISRWVDGGAKEGKNSESVVVAKFEDGWTIGKPDLVIEMPNAVHVAATGTVPYTWIVMPTGLTEDKWIDAIEVRPGVREVVHHIVLYSRDAGASYMSKALPGVPFTPPGRVGTPPPTKDEGKGIWEFQVASRGVEIQSVYVPGGAAYTSRPGQARLLKGGADLVFQMHYTASGKDAMDRSRVGIRFAKEPPKERIFNTFLANPHLQIPAGAANHEITATVTLAMDTVLQSMAPHTHVRGRAFRYRAIYPSGESEILLDVPHYDFNWQLTYLLDQPKILPKGTKIECKAWYDNSVNNPANPDATKDVRWGDQTWEEMLAGFMDFVVPVDFQPSHLIRGRPADKASN